MTYFARHITLTARQGLVTELERIGSGGNEECYILRCHKASERSRSVIDVHFAPGAALWTGFRYQDAHWSFISLNAVD